MSSNRREVLLAAGGIAAATSMVGSGHALADRKNTPVTPRLVVDMVGIGSFDAGSLQWGAGLGVGAPQGGGPRDTSAPSVSEAVITKNDDALSPLLFEALVKARVIDVVTITHLVPKGLGATYTLEDVIISGFSQSGGGSSTHLSDSLSLNFAKIRVAFGPNDVTYDLVSGKVS